MANRYPDNPGEDVKEKLDPGLLPGLPVQGLSQRDEDHPGRKPSTQPEQQKRVCAVALRFPQQNQQEVGSEDIQVQLQRSTGKIQRLIGLLGGPEDPDTSTSPRGRSSWRSGPQHSLHPPVDVAGAPGFNEPVKGEYVITLDGRKNLVPVTVPEQIGVVEKVPAFEVQVPPGVLQPGKLLPNYRAELFLLFLVFLGRLDSSKVPVPVRELLGAFLQERPHVLLDLRLVLVWQNFPHLFEVLRPVGLQAPQKQVELSSRPELEARLKQPLLLLLFLLREVQHLLVHRNLIHRNQERVLVDEGEAARLGQLYQSGMQFSHVLGLPFVELQNPLPVVKLPVAEIQKGALDVLLDFHLERLRFLLAPGNDCLYVLLSDVHVRGLEDFVCPVLNHRHKLVFGESVVFQVLVLQGALALESALLDDRKVQLKLEVRPLDYLLFYGVFMAESEDEDGLFLADPVGPVHGLEVRLGVPVRVIENHDVGSGQVNPQASGSVREASNVAVVLQDIQNSSHLAEDQDSASPRNELLDQPVHQHHLAGVLHDVLAEGISGLVLVPVEQVGVVASLSELHGQVDESQLASSILLLEGIHVLGEQVLVELPLHVGLKLIRIRENLRVEEVQERPELSEAILERSPGTSFFPSGASHRMSPARRRYPGLRLSHQ
ncbi:hypothetical protein HWI79_3231 [Cryptosporidium felis]|nr:hypothetical protein HWI79_3231 [Cryptosporidium felis]